MQHGLKIIVPLVGGRTEKQDRDRTTNRAYQAALVIVPLDGTRSPDKRLLFVTISDTSRTTLVLLI